MSRTEVLSSTLADQAQQIQTTVPASKNRLLESTMKKIKDLSVDIIKKSIELMTLIDTDLIDKFIYDLRSSPKLSKTFKKMADAELKDIIYEHMKIYSYKYVDDAHKIISEIDNFIKVDGIKIHVNIIECPLLGEAWAGDSYDKQGIEGLEELLKSLQSDFDAITEEKIKDYTEKLLPIETKKEEKI